MTGVEQIFSKIREICEECYEGAEDQIKIPRNYKNLSSSQQLSSRQIPQLIIKQYMTVLEYLEQYIHQLIQCKNQYQNLQQSLQKQQLQIRKHIGIEQQLRLYSESVKIQLEECQKEKLELLENSKLTIKNIKMKNQTLFQEITSLKRKIHQHQKMQQNPKPSSNIKTKHKEKTQSSSKQRKDSSLSKIIKTEYIERQKHPFLNVNIKKQLKYKNQPEIKKHKHHKSIYAKDEEVNNSKSKKKYRMELLQKAKKEKGKASHNSKQFDLGTYLSKNQLKRSPYKNIDKHSAKHNSSKRNQKHHKSSFQERSQKTSKLQTEQKGKRDQVKEKQECRQSSKQKSKSKESKKVRSKEQGKQKAKQGKKAVQHNRSLFSVSSVEYRSGVRYTS